MIKTIIGQIDPMVRVEEVRATKGKHVRAEPVVALYEQGLIEHAPGLGELEEQMMSWVPNVSPSPDRVDALVWALHNLALSSKPCLSIGWA
jgi:phage terminase large subunit-like protein